MDPCDDKCMCISKMQKFLPSSLRSSMYSCATAGRKVRAFNKWENVACHTNYSKQTLSSLKRNNILINKHPLQTEKRPWMIQYADDTSWTLQNTQTTFAQRGWMAPFGRVPGDTAENRLTLELISTHAGEAQSFSSLIGMLLRALNGIGRSPGVPTRLIRISYITQIQVLVI